MVEKAGHFPLERGLSIEKPNLSLPNFQRLLNCNQRRAADPANVPYASCYNSLRTARYGSRLDLFHNSINTP